jgi:hypothetical protein
VMLFILVEHHPLLLQTNYTIGFTYFPVLPCDIPANAIYLNNFDGEYFSRDYVFDEMQG